MFSISNRSSHHAGERAGGSVLYTHPKRILAIYHDATPQSDRSVCRRGSAGNAQNGWQRSSKARGRALISAVPYSPRRGLIYAKVQWLMRDAAVRPLPLGQPVPRPEISAPARRAPRWRADRRSLRAEDHPSANSGYRGVCALFIAVDCGCFDFESLDMNAAMSAATSSGFSSSAKWPASIRWTSASGISRL